MRQKSTNISLSEDLWEAAQILAIRRRISFTALVRIAISNELTAINTTDEICIDTNGECQPMAARVFLDGLADLRRQSRG